MQKINSRNLLKLVSRSFALCIPLLDKNKRDKVENQYLLARFLDTIEDSEHTINDKSILASAFISGLSSESTESLLSLKSAVLSKTIASHDKTLIANSDIVFKKFFSFDKEIKKMSVHFLHEMADGMMRYQTKKIYTFKDLDDYCYYVASTVGLYLTQLVKTVDNFSLDKEMAKSFGRFLQKINIIKDAKTDLKENRFFWPLSLFENENPNPYFENEQYKNKALAALDAMTESVKNEIEPTFTYISNISEKAKGYRKFALISSIMAYKTLLLMKDNYQVFSGDCIKIKRKEVMNILFKAKFSYYNNERLLSYIKCEAK